ncbi:MAG TPA: metallophosphoesterase [Geminicoccus sp.]|uniref:metallophosphoesterase n=1 Tax=Geminicoccus sp. TaxID=2024832 RepID=UPI002B8F7F6D|nr:metallophosphoesterase [Geminicoccus sp.]HWL67163.1 metallophosphoesterase [Geminicoccus sp.]
MGTDRTRLARRGMLAGLAGFPLLLRDGRPARAQEQAPSVPPTDVTFLFSNDVHTCRMGNGLSPNCAEEGKTDENLLRHIRALNRVTELRWPAEIGGKATGLASAGQPIAPPLGLVLGGDLTDDGGGQTALPEEGSQLVQFSERYRQGEGDDRVHMPVYLGLGNHDLDQDGHPPDVDWYRRELRDYVEVNHRSGVFFHPSVPVPNYHVDSDSYSWDWDGLHLVQCQRFAGDTGKGAISGLDWLKADLAAHAADGRPVILFQHYGWDSFSTEHWDPARHTFDPEGAGPAHWWTDAERGALLDAIWGHNVIGIFHGHQHESALIYRAGQLDIFKPKAAFLGGFAVVRVTDHALDVVLCEAAAEGSVVFDQAFSKTLS